MSKYNTFRKRMGRGGVKNHKENLMYRTRKRQEQLFFNSPSLRYIDIVDEEENVPVVISEDDKFNSKRFLFEPDKEVKTGWLLKDREKYYLAVKRTDDEIYPQIFTKLCNDYFVIKETKKELVGYNELGNPKFKEVTIENKIPAVLHTKVYTAIGNAIFNLPSGALVVEIPYKKEYLDYLKQNGRYEMNTGIYAVTEISRQGVIFGEEGYLTINLQRKVEGNQ